MVASHALLGLFGLEGLVFPVCSHTGHTLVVASTVHGFHVLDPIRGGIQALPIQFLIYFVLFRVPLFFLGGLAQSWHIHALAPTIGRHTRPPTHVTFGMDWASVCSGHDGPAAAAQSARGVDGNSRGRGDALGPNVWLGNGDRPAGSTLGLSQSAQVLGVVWGAWVV